MIETIIFNVTVVSLLIPLIGTIIMPRPFQIESTNYAKKQGWSMPVILLTRTIPYLTLYTQFWVLIAMYYKTPITMFIGQSMAWNVFILYHGINLINPMNLAYHPETLVKEVVRWTPPFSKYIIIWFGLHLQHTVFPFYLIYLKNKYSIDYNSCTLCFPTSFLIMGIYMIWHLFCWYVQGIPAYPFLTELRTAELEIAFYLAGIIPMIIINKLVIA